MGTAHPGPTLSSAPPTQNAALFLTEETCCGFLLETAGEGVKAILRAASSSIP